MIGDLLRQAAQSPGQRDQQGLRDARPVEQAAAEQVPGNAENP